MSHFKLAVPRGSAFHIVFLSFLLSLTASLISPVFPIFVQSFVHNPAYVGYFVAFTSLIMVISNLLSSKILSRISRLSFLKFSSIGYAFTSLILAFVSNFTQLIILEIFRTFFAVAAFVATGLLIREYSKLKDLSSIEGWYFTIGNIAFLIGPLVGGLLGAHYGYKFLFIISAIFPLIFFIVLSSTFSDGRKVEFNHTNIFSNAVDFFKNRNLAIVYLSSIGLTLWWLIVYIFVPLYIISNHLSETLIGYVLFAVAAPLIMLEISAGKLTKYFGFKKLLFFGFIAIAICAVLTFIASVKVTLILIILASFGAAFVEPLREPIFFSNVKHKDELKYYPVYRTSLDVSRLVGPFVFSTILLYSSFRVLFLVAGIITFLFALIVLLLKER